jgi:hypothetical protein
MSHIIFYAVKILTRLGAKRNLLEEETMIHRTDNIENSEKKIQNGITSVQLKGMNQSKR